MLRRLPRALLRPGLSVASLTLALVLAVLLPSLAIGIAATWYAVSGERAAAERRLTDTARDTALVLDQEFTGVVDAMIAFAASPAFGVNAGPPDVPELHRQAQQIAGQLHVAVGIARPDGTRVLHSAHSLGEALPPMHAHALVRQVAETGKAAVGELITGSLSGRPTIIIAAPVRGADGHASLVVFAALPPGAIGGLLRASARPDGALITVTDRQNAVVARSDALNDRFIGQRITELAVRASQGRAEGVFVNVGLEGMRRTYAFHAVQAAPGWTVFVAIPERDLNSAWRTPLLMFGVGATAALSLGLLLALLAARPILMPLRRLAEHARAIVASNGDADPAADAVPMPPPSRVAELEYLRLGFAAAEATLRRRAEAERRAANALANREAQLRALFDASPIGLGRATVDGRMLEANDVLLGILGVSRDAIHAGQVRWSDLTAPDSVGITETAITEALASSNGRSTGYTKAFIRPDGTRVQVLVSFAVMNHETGEAAVFVVDMTEAEKTQSRLRDLLVTIDMGAFLTRDLDGTIRYWSAGCQRVYGWTAQDAVGQRAHDLLQTVWPMPLQDVNAALLATGEWSGDLRQRTREGRSIVVSALKRLRPDAGGERAVLELITDVTAQRHAEAALAESEAHLRPISEASPDLIYSTDVYGRLTYANPALVTLLGRPVADIMGQHVACLHGDPDDATDNTAHDRIVMASGQPSTFDEVLRQPDGTVRVYLSSKAPLRDPDTGAVIGIAAISRDITDARANETTKARLAAIVTSTPDAVISYAHGDGHILTWNQGAETLFGYTEAEAVGAPVALLVPDWVRKDHPTGVFALVIQGQVVRDYETVRRAKSGLEIPVAITAARMHAPDGSIIGVSAIFRDQRPRLLAEAALRSSEARWRTLAESFPGFVIETDGDGRNTYANTSMQAFTGVSGDALLGDGWRAVIYPDDLDRTVAAWQHAVRTGATFEIEHRFRAADGHYGWYLGRGLPQRDADGAIVRWWIVFIDITEIVAAREAATRNTTELEQLVQARTQELDAAQQRLAQAAKMEALGRLAGGVAHDFNNVLQAVQGGVALALARLKAHPDRVPRYLNLVSDAAERGVAVTGRLLAFARRGDLSAEPVQPVPLLDGLAEMLRHTMGPSITVRVDARADTPPMLADKAQLETVLVNLANNARDALPNAVGTINLSAEPAPPPFGFGLTGECYVRLSVVDDGAGMSPDLLARVSEPFFTTKPRGAGTGLGLAMARGFAEQSGGALVIDSEVGRGTTVSMWLPLAPAATTAAPAAHRPDQTSATKHSVLVVDDEQMVRTVVTTVLADNGHQVADAADARSALALLDAGLEVDVLLTDLAMPGELDGLGLIREARRRHPGLPALLLTGHTGDAAEGALAAAFEGGPFMVLHKPISAPLLEEKVSLLLGG